MKRAPVSQAPMNVVELITMIGPAVTGVYFDIEGVPEAQERPRILWRHIPVPRFYDPSARRKRFLSKLVMTALKEHGHDHFPLFPSDRNMKVSLTFMMPNILQKDIDNMEKFIFDALEGIVYRNDRRIVKVQSEKVSSAVPKTIVGIELV